MNKEEFLQRNARNFGKGKYEPLQVYAKKLQAKYNAIKRKWRETKTDHKKVAAWLQRVIQSGRKKLIQTN